MKIEFTKMQGAANDYIYVNCLEKELDNPSEIAIAMSKRHFSVGADGLVMICKSKVADAKMRMFNADGSEGRMCGNAIRCVGKYLYDNGIAKKEKLTIETLSGIKVLSLVVKQGKVYSVTVDMGVADIAPTSLPIRSDKPFLNTPYTVGGKQYRLTCVSVGNPHCIVFVDKVADYDVEGIGKLFETDELFPERVNTEFVEVIDRKHLKMRVWERGSGETFACGTGASAVVVACVLNGYCDYDSAVTVELLGGELQISVSRALKVFMTGKAVKVYDGVYEYEH